MPEYLIAPFNQPVWRGLKQRIQQEHLKKTTENKISGRALGGMGSQIARCLTYKKKKN